MNSKYEKWRGHKADFEVNYRFYTEQEGGRKNPPGQYYRGDFMYYDDKPEDGIYMIHHEFTDKNGNILEENESFVPIEGTARMWIVIPEMRDKIHKDRIKTGTKYFIMEGSRKVGEGIVIKILDLETNPITEVDAREREKK